MPHILRVDSIPRERILGLAVHPLSKADAVAATVDRALSERPGGYVCLANVHTTVEAQDSPALRASLENAFLSVPDGMPLVWILRRRGHPRTEKVTGIEFMPLVATAGLQSGLRHYLYGGAPGVAERASRRLETLVPGTRVVGASTPPFAPIDEWPIDELRRELDRTKPHILWVGLGAPKQELWMGAMAGEIQVPVVVGVGAAFDYLAGTKPSAPAGMRHIGLEWLFRLAVEPRRLWRRYLLGNARFTWLLLRQVFRTRPSGMRSPNDQEVPR